MYISILSLYHIQLVYKITWGELSHTVDILAGDNEQQWHDVAHGRRRHDGLANETKHDGNCWLHGEVRGKDWILVWARDSGGTSQMQGIKAFDPRPNLLETVDWQVTQVSFRPPTITLSPIENIKNQWEKDSMQEDSVSSTSVSETHGSQPRTDEERYSHKLKNGWLWNSTLACVTRTAQRCGRAGIHILHPSHIAILHQYKLCLRHIFFK